MTVLIYIVLGLTPGLFWLWFYHAKDKKRPESNVLLFKVFLWGMVATIPAAALEFLADRYIQFSSSEDFSLILVGALFVVAPIEEYLKYLVVKKRVYDLGRFDEAFDGMIYAIVASLGFASFENILAAFTKGLDALFLRFITATLLHALTAGVIGYFLGLARFDKAREKWLIAQGIIAAIVIHGVYNFILATETPLTLILIAVLLIVVFMMVAGGIKEMQRRDDRTIKKKSFEKNYPSSTHHE